MANPTIGATTPRIQYTATSSQTVFTVPFEFLANADLAVYVNGTLKTLTTDYTLTGANTTGGGSLTFVTGRTAGEIVTILGNLAYSRDTNKYTKYGLLPAEVLEADFDALQVQVKQLALADQFALRAPLTDTGTPDMVLPAKATRATKVLGFDSDGDPVASTNSLSDIDLAVTTVNTIGAAPGNLASNISFVPSGTLSSVTVQNAIQEVVTDLSASSGAATVGFAPTGTLSSTTVQGAIAELMSENVYAIKKAKAPLVLECFTSFSDGASYGTPSGIGSWTDGEGKLTVTGTVGSTSLTINSVDIGVIANYGNSAATEGMWGCVIQHDDGSFGCYSAYNAITGSVSIVPALTKAVTSKGLWNLYDSALGQHLTTYGYTALAYFVSMSYIRDGLRNVAQGQATYNGSRVFNGTAFALTGGLTTGGFLSGTTIVKGLFQSAVLNLDGIASTSTRYNGSGRKYYTHSSVAYTQVGAETAGQGVTHTVDLKGSSGVVDVAVGIIGQKDSGTLASRIAVVVTVDGVVQSTTYVTGLQRVTVPFYNGNSGTISFTLETSAPTAFAIGNLNWFIFDDAMWAQSLLIQSGSKVVLCMDSWGTFHSNAFATALATYTGATITNSSVGGTQASYAITNFDTMVTAYNPDYVIFDFLINDYNAAIGAATWLNNVAKLCRMAIDRGITPILLSGMGTASQSQAQGMSEYYSELLSYFPVRSTVVINSAINSASSASPTGTTSTTGVHMGVGLTVAPTKTGNVMVMVSGMMGNNTNGGGAVAGLRYGTGTAPANAATLTGTAIASNQSYTSAASTDPSGFAISKTLTGLTVGTTYWFDLSLAAITAGTASATGVNMSVIEIA
jgi:hypothetical protein